MNAFEAIIAGLFKQEGYWTEVGYKVNLPKEMKAALGKPSLPRPEIDILAYKVRENVLLWIECKSFLDSRGVCLEHIINCDHLSAARYKVFTWHEFRRIVTNSLVQQLVEKGLVLPNPTVKYCLSAGRIASESDRSGLHKYFAAQGWLLFDENWIKEKLDNLSKVGYEDDVAVIVAKLFTKIR